MRIALIAAPAMLAAMPLAAGAQAPADAPTTITMVISAQDAAGLPVPGVAFEATGSGLGRQSATTSNTGLVRLALPPGTKADSVTLHVADPRFQMPEPPRRITASTTAPTQFFIANLLPADVSAMNPLERSALVEALPTVYRQRWAKGEKADSGPLRFAAFLEGFGEEEAPDPDAVRAALATPTVLPTAVPGARLATPAPAPTLEITVKDRSGAPQPNRTVLLFRLAETAGRIRQELNRRTGPDGTVQFSPLEPGVAYRALVPEDASGLYAPSPIVVLPPAEAGKPARLEETLVLRERSRSVSGLVFDGDRPARGVRLRTQDPTQPTVETVSDENGYFEIGPLRPGETRLVLEEPRTRRTAAITAALGAGELLVPLDLLLSP